MELYAQLQIELPDSILINIASDTMKQRMIKSAEEIELITTAATIADVGGPAIHKLIKPGVREIDVAMGGIDVDYPRGNAWGWWLS